MKWHIVKGALRDAAVALVATLVGALLGGCAVQGLELAVGAHDLALGDAAMAVASRPSDSLSSRFPPLECPELSMPPLEQ